MRKKHLKKQVLKLYLMDAHFNEIVVNCKKSVKEVNAHLFTKGIIGGYDLGLTYPEFANHALIAVTEQRTKEEIDALVQEMEALHA